MSSDAAFIANAHSQSAGHLRQDLRVGRHTFVADEPEAQGGEDSGPAPFAFVLSGLAACTGITLEMYAARKSWTLGAVKVDVALFQTGPDAHRIERTITFEAPLTDEQRARLLEIAEKTPVTRFTKRAATIVTTLG